MLILTLIVTLSFGGETSIHIPDPVLKEYLLDVDPSNYYQRNDYDVRPVLPNWPKPDWLLNNILQISGFLDCPA